MVFTKPGHIKQCACIIAISCLVQQSLAVTETGLVTMYGGPQDGQNPNSATGGLSSGSCGYGLLDQSQWPYWQAAAIGPGNPLNSGGNPGGCGSCVQITCASGCNVAKPVIVLVTDSCAECSPTQLNINALTFENNLQSNLGAGQVTATWQQVPCNPPGNINIVVTNARSNLGGYLVVTLQQVGGTGTISSVSFQPSGSSSWTPMTNFFGVAYQISNIGSPPFSLQIQGQGQTLVARNAITTVADGTYPTSVQFGGSSPAAGSANSATSTPPFMSIPSSPPVLPTGSTSPPAQAPPTLSPPPVLRAPPPAQLLSFSPPPVIPMPPPPVVAMANPSTGLASSPSPTPVTPPPANTILVNPYPPPQAPPQAPPPLVPVVSPPPVLVVPPPDIPKTLPSPPPLLPSPAPVIASTPPNATVPQSFPAVSPPAISNPPQERQPVLPALPFPAQAVPPPSAPPTPEVALASGAGNPGPVLGPAPQPDLPPESVQSPARTPDQAFPVPSPTDSGIEGISAPIPQSELEPGSAPFLAPAAFPETSSAVMSVAAPAPPSNTSTAPVPAPQASFPVPGNSTSSAPVPLPAPAAGPSISPAAAAPGNATSPVTSNGSDLAPGKMTLSVNSGLSGENVNAANNIVNPAISVTAGRKRKQQ